MLILLRTCSSIGTVNINVIIINIEMLGKGAEFLKNGITRAYFGKLYNTGLIHVMRNAPSNKNTHTFNFTSNTMITQSNQASVATLWLHTFQGTII